MLRRRQGSVHIEIKMNLYRYRVARAADGRLFAYGYDRATADVRIIELQSFDASSVTGFAKDGSEVTLEGAPARDLNAGWFWFRFCADNGLTGCTDVTP